MGSHCDNDHELIEKLPRVEENIWENETTRAGKHSAMGGCNDGDGFIKAKVS